METNDLLNKETDKVLNEYQNQKLAAKAYFIFSIALIMILGIFICVKSAEIQALKDKAHNDSLAVQSLKNNLLMP